MNLPVVEVTVQALRGSRVCGKTPSSENSKVILIRTTEKSSSMLLCIIMICIATPKYPSCGLKTFQVL